MGGAVFTGDFAYVESASGEEGHQAFLAAYEVGPVSCRSFRPSIINGQVKSVEALPNGLLAVGGTLDTVNGENHNGFVLLDPKTGQVAKQWDIRSEPHLFPTGAGEDPARPRQAPVPRWLLQAPEG